MEAIVAIPTERGKFGSLQFGCPSPPVRRLLNRELVIQGFLAKGLNLLFLPIQPSLHPSSYLAQWPKLAFELSVLTGVLLSKKSRKILDANAGPASMFSELAAGFGCRFFGRRVSSKQALQPALASTPRSPKHPRHAATVPGHLRRLSRGYRW